MLFLIQNVIDGPRLSELRTQSVSVICHSCLPLSIFGTNAHVENQATSGRHNRTHARRRNASLQVQNITLVFRCGCRRRDAPLRTGRKIQGVGGSVLDLSASIVVRLRLRAHQTLEDRETVCVCEREREREKERQIPREREGERKIE